jgi:hypothetical protein
VLPVSRFRATTTSLSLASLSLLVPLLLVLLVWLVRLVLLLLVFFRPRNTAPKLPAPRRLTSE